jgi:pyridoxine 5-phosphate synthase
MNSLPSSKMATALSVNVNLVAYVRNRRTVGVPDVVRAARLCLQAGAQGITVHPRPDARHITAEDVEALAELLRADFPKAEFNIEGNPFHNLMDFIRKYRPQQATFVPDSHEQATSDHGWSFPADADRLRPLVEECKALKVRVSLFMDPDPDAMAAVRALGADRVELYTESFASAFGTSDQETVLARFTATARAALAAGLGINAGHDLSRENLPSFVRALPQLDEVSIGHALMSEALEAGYAETVRRYLQVLNR